ncbi:MAG TPA: hypothetical protein VER58_10685 [Thermoanaerobaculia bacterium]|nr:hypothetical protein [Thermoanaerobaculia bacterium]
MLVLRRYSTLLLFFAAVIVAEPLLHSHPLQQNSIPGACAVCATGVGRLPRIAPAISAPRVIVYTLTPSAIQRVIVPAVSTLPSRAPPAS